MRKITRPAEVPAPLHGNEVAWGLAFQERRVANPNHRFQWKTFDHQLVSHTILPNLKGLTDDHCSYCDGFPFDMSPETIDHFKPKSVFPELVYTWSNLFVSCSYCQAAKLEQFNDHLLKPDAPDYELDAYFILDYKTGEILPNPAAIIQHQERARETIRIFDLNNDTRNQSRLRQRRRYVEGGGNINEINDFSYRFFLI